MKLIKKIMVMLAILLAVSTVDATMYYVLYNYPAEYGSECSCKDGVICDVTELNTSSADANCTVLRIFDIPPTNNLAVPKTASKLTYQQWNDTEMAEGGLEGAMALFQVDILQIMY